MCSNTPSTANAEAFQGRIFSVTHIKCFSEKSTSSFLRLRFTEIGGTLEVVCDRCSSNLPPRIVWWIFVDGEDGGRTRSDEWPGRRPGCVLCFKRPGVTWMWKAGFSIHQPMSIPMQKTCSVRKYGQSINQLPRCCAPCRVSGTTINPVWKGLEKFKDLDKGIIVAANNDVFSKHYMNILNKITAKGNSNADRTRPPSNAAQAPRTL